MRLMHGRTINDGSNVSSLVLMFPFRRTAFEVGRFVYLRES
jgi:hypothetical protein